MVKSKRYYAERVISGLQNRYPNIDFKIDFREVFLAIDDIVNSLAKKNYFDNWKTTGEGIDEQFITTFSVAVVDQEREHPSYFVLPANYAALPNNRGIEEIWPETFQLNGQDFSVVVLSRSDWRRYKNFQAGKFQGRLAGYPENHVDGNRFVFTTHDVKKKYGNTMGVRLVIKDSSQISETAPYPIPGDLEGDVIEMCINFFYEKRLSMTDTVRDKNDISNPTSRRIANNGGQEATA
jgi:hypothetical protein